VNFLDGIGQAVRVDIDGQSRGQDSGCVRSMSITRCFVRDHGRNAGTEHRYSPSEQFVPQTVRRPGFARQIANCLMPGDQSRLV